MSLLFEWSEERVGVVLAIGIRFSIWWLVGSSVDCILDRLVGSIFVSAAEVGKSRYMVLGFSVVVYKNFRYLAI